MILLVPQTVSVLVLKHLPWDAQNAPHPYSMKSKSTSDLEVAILVFYSFRFRNNLQIFIFPLMILPILRVQDLIILEILEISLGKKYLGLEMYLGKLANSLKMAMESKYHLGFFIPKIMQPQFKSILVL